ncbi:MAG: YraN family protein [Planctomycetes bacterium]|nr:YraN family protein [Planctomycetota bacterium]
MFILELIGSLWARLRRRGEDGRGASATRAVGDRAEEFALAHLKQLGFRVLERNLHDEDGELDLVGRMKGLEGLVVVEVRARKTGGLITPREAVDARKQRQVVQTARRLLRRKGYHDVLRFDVVGVYLDGEGNPTRAEHFPDAFDARVLRERA